MMIGDEHPHALRTRRRDTGDAGNATVHRDQQIGALLRGHSDDLRRQSVTEIEAVRDEIANLLTTHQTQGAHGQGTAGRAVGIEIADHQNALAFGQGLLQQIQCARQTAQLFRRHQSIDAGVQLFRIGYPTRRIHTPQYRRQARRQVCGIDFVFATDDTFFHDKLSFALQQRAASAPEPP